MLGYADCTLLAQGIARMWDSARGEWETLPEHRRLPDIHVEVEGGPYSFGEIRFERNPAAIPQSESIAAHAEPDLYGRLVNRFQTDSGGRIAVHGHRNVAPIPDATIK